MVSELEDELACVYLCNVEDITVRYLKRLWNMEKDQVKNFGEFIRRYNDLFCTKEVLKRVYKVTDLKSDFSKYLSSLRKSKVNNFKFYTEKDIENVLRELVEKLKMGEK